MNAKQLSKKIRPILGHFYAVPLMTGTYACGWVRAVGRKSSDPILLLVFENAYEGIPSRSDLDSLELKNLFNFYFVSKHGIESGSWIPLGENRKFPLESWPIPPLCSGGFTSKALACQYDESLNVIKSRVASKKDQESLKSFIVLGSLMIERRLTLYLDDKLPREFDPFLLF